MERHYGKGTVSRFPKLFEDWLMDVRPNDKLLEQMVIDLEKDDEISPNLKVILSNLFNMILTPAVFANVMVPHHGLKILDLAKNIPNESGLKIYAITNYNGVAYDELQKRYPEIISKFDDIIVSGKAHMMKPSATIYRYAIDKWKLEGKHILYIDDEEDNIDAAKAFGWKTIHYNTLGDAMNTFVSFLEL